MSKVRLLRLLGLLLLVLGYSGLAVAQDATPEQAAAIAVPDQLPPGIYRPQGQVIVPDSSLPQEGMRAHTMYRIFQPAGLPLSTPTPMYTFAETPASLACVYKVGTAYPGCNPSTGGTRHAGGGWGAIALVDAYDYPTAAADLTYFSSYFGLPLPGAKFTKVYANTGYGTMGGLTASCSGVPPANVGWGVEAALDIQWAHAMAPSAKIILVEACSNSYNDLFFAELVAGKLVTAAGGGTISNSWGGGEFSNQLGPPAGITSGWDNFFYRYYWKNITYFASSGDYGYGASYPSTNPWVVSAGGTTINRDVNGNFLSESCWSGSGGGNSAIEIWQDPDSVTGGATNAIYYGMGPWVGYQYKLFGGFPYATAPRSTPDISFNADPASGAYVYNTYGHSGWMVVGGTSLSSPALAGIINAANNRLGQAPPAGGKFYTAELGLLYNQVFTNLAYKTNFYDVTTGSNGVSAVAGYDQCTGIGSPRGKLGK